MDTYLCFDIYLELDHSYNKYSNLIGYWQVSMCDSHLQVLPSGSSNTKLYDLNLLDTNLLVSMGFRRPQGSHRTLASLGILYSPLVF